MSAKLTKAILSGRVLVKKRTGGEVAVCFHTDKPPVYLNTEDAVDLLGVREDLTIYDLQRSNLNDLIKRRAIDVL